MMDDNKSKNYNSIIASLVCEFIFEGENRDLSTTDCYNHIKNTLKINLEPNLFKSILEKDKGFILTAEADYITVRLSPEKFAEINRKIDQFSLEHHIAEFAKSKGYSTKIKEGIEKLIYQSIYENINSFSIETIKSILPEQSKTRYASDEIEAFNCFLDFPDRQKNTALFSVFLKAVEFAILTSGKGVKSFTKNIFLGKEYCLDSNIIFRMLGVNGRERQESINNLMLACMHQGIKFQYAGETLKEVKRKIEASIREIKAGAESKAIDLLHEMIEENLISVNNSFITHYAQCKSQGLIKSAEQYEYKLLADFKELERKYKLKAVPTNFKPKQIFQIQDFLFKKKKEINEYGRYTMTAAKVDACNVLLVREKRGSNNFNYSDIRSFYLTTDRTLNSILAATNQEQIAETILPSQLYILHNALSDPNDQEDRDYQDFNKFLKRRTTNFKYEGRDVLNFIDEIRHITADTFTIKEVIKAYSDKRYENGFKNDDIEPEIKSFREFAETVIDQKLGQAIVGDQKYQSSLAMATANLPVLLKKAKYEVRTVDIIVSTMLIPIAGLIIRQFTDKLPIIFVGVIVIELIKFMISSKTSILSDWCKMRFMKKVQNSAFSKAFGSTETTYIKSAENMIIEDINVYK